MIFGKPLGGRCSLTKEGINQESRKYGLWKTEMKLRREKGICSMLVKGDSRMAAVPQTKRAAFTGTLWQKRQECWQCHTVIMIHCATELSFQSDETTGGFATLKQDVNQERGRCETQDRESKPGERQMEFRGWQLKGHPRMTVVLREELSQRKENGYIKEGWKREKKKKGTDMFPNGIDLVEIWKVWVGTKAIINFRGKN